MGVLNHQVAALPRAYTIEGLTPGGDEGGGHPLLNCTRGRMARACFGIASWECQPSNNLKAFLAELGLKGGARAHRLNGVWSLPSAGTRSVTVEEVSAGILPVKRAATDVIVIDE
jgi:hypothetical protein